MCFLGVFFYFFFLFYLLCLNTDTAKHFCESINVLRLLHTITKCFIEFVPFLDGFAARSAQQRHMVAKWSRDDLEDKYLRMYEESLILKKHARKQEDKIKRLVGTMGKRM